MFVECTDRLEADLPKICKKKKMMELPMNNIVLAQNQLPVFRSYQ